MDNYLDDIDNRFQKMKGYVVHLRAEKNITSIECIERLDKIQAFINSKSELKFLLNSIYYSFKEDQILFEYTMRIILNYSECMLLVSHFNNNIKRILTENKEHDVEVLVNLKYHIAYYISNESSRYTESESILFSIIRILIEDNNNKFNIEELSYVLYNCNTHDLKKLIFCMELSDDFEMTDEIKLILNSITKNILRGISYESTL